MDAINLPNYVEVLSVLKDFKTEIHPTTKATMYTGYINDVEKYDAFLDHLKQIGYPYSVRNSDQATSKKVFYSSNFGIINIPFFGSPFMVERSSIQDCVCGKPYYKRNSIIATTVDEYKAEKAKLAETGVTNRRIQKPSKRINCPAALWTRCIRIFEQPEYETDEQTASNWRKAKVIRKKLNDDLMEPDPPASTLRFYIALSAFKEHTHPPIPLSEKSKLRAVKTKIRESVKIPAKVSQLEENRKRKLVIDDNISSEVEAVSGEEEEKILTRAAKNSTKVVIISVGNKTNPRSAAKPKTPGAASLRKPIQRKAKKLPSPETSENTTIKGDKKVTENPEKLTEKSTEKSPGKLTENISKVNKENANVVIIKRIAKKRKRVFKKIEGDELNAVIADIEGAKIPEPNASEHDEVWEFNVMEPDTNKESCEQVEEMTVEVVEESEECQVVTDLIRDAALRVADLVHLCDDTDTILLEYYSAIINLEDQMKAHCIRHQGLTEETVEEEILP